ncbi:response regulator transcription factor, partial [Micromonospora sp. NPDC023814]|uniref:response regulator transcription factor n=1 Tax=Micromonospora sp. NPDC023814 TaxID=3154596 RepID=UPI0033D14603
MVCHRNGADRAGRPPGPIVSEGRGRSRTGVIRVMLVDDQAVVRAGFRVILEQAGDIEVVAEASSGSSAVQLARRTSPDVICMDI